MATKMTAVWPAFCFLASVPFISGYCPPLTPGWNDLETSNSDYFIVSSQADADQLKTCHTFKGELIISGRNATAPLIIDGPRRIEGELTMRLYSGPENPLFTSVSMKSLIWNLGVLDFPALRSVAPTFMAISLDSVHTLNFPSLEHAGFFWFNVIPELHTIHAPKLTELGWLQLRSVPSLTTTPSFFAARFNGAVGKIDISGTGLTDISFPNIEVLSDLIVGHNKDLTTVSLPAVTLVTEFVGRGGGYITITDDYPNFHLSLPKLKTVTGTVSLSSLREVEIPELRTIGRNPNYARLLGSLLVGVGADFWTPRCANCHPTYLTTFDAPKLRTVEGRIQFDTSPELTSISFPILKSAKEFITNNTAAMELENGISMPSFRHVEHVQILGTESRCDFFENLYCGGGVVGNYSCGTIEVWDPSQSKQFKKWPSFPPDCAGEVHPLPKEDVDMTDRLDWMSGFIFEDCRLNYRQYCVPRRTLRTGFLVTLVFFVVTTAILWCIAKRWLKRKR
ncbi:hypothetical protein BDZ45DRAFT_745317 [Acephala macrosclerotiorum]|nr:hypothetical protein BDZ45DRAFT_745317 [Acephala macrosclerotiorum]